MRAAAVSAVEGNDVVNPQIIYVFVFASASAVAALICLLFVRDESTVQARLKELSDPGVSDFRPTATAAGSSVREALKRALLRFGSAAHIAGSSPQSERLSFIRAGIYSPNASALFTATRLLLMIVPVVSGLLFAGLYGIRLQWVLIAGAPLGAVGMLAPAWWLAPNQEAKSLVTSGTPRLSRCDGGVPRKRHEL